LLLQKDLIDSSLIMMDVKYEIVWLGF